MHGLGVRQRERLAGRDRCRTCMMIIGFVSSPLVLLLGAAAVIGVG